MTDIETLLALEEIKQLKARYFRCVDSKDWAGLAQVFAPDAILDLADGARARNPLTGEFDQPPLDFPPLTSVEAIVAQISQSVQRLVTVHHGHMPEIRLTSGTSAEGIWAMEDMLRSPDGTPLPWAPPFTNMHGYGYYHESYRRIEGSWRIAFLRLTRLRVDLS
jgi:hypothetical protein